MMHYLREQRKVQSKADRKLRLLTQHMKEEIGIKSDGTIHFDY